VTKTELQSLRDACGFTEAIMELARKNGADLTLEGVERRFYATRAAVRYRNPETGQRHHVHFHPYKHSIVRTLRMMRAEIKYLKEQACQVEI